MTIKHSEEFKQEAVRIALTSGLPRARVASDLGVGLSNQTFPSGGHSSQYAYPSRVSGFVQSGDSVFKRDALVD